MTEDQTNDRIKTLQATLTGNLFTDGEIQQEIYELKKSLKPEIVDNPELDDFEECLSCGS